MIVLYKVDRLCRLVGGEGVREKMHRYFLTGAIVMVTGIGLCVCGPADWRLETGGLGTIQYRPRLDIVIRVVMDKDHLGGFWHLLVVEFPRWRGHSLICIFRLVGR